MGCPTLRAGNSVSWAAWAGSAAFTGCRSRAGKSKYIPFALQSALYLACTCAYDEGHMDVLETWTCVHDHGHMDVLETWMTPKVCATEVILGRVTKIPRIRPKRLYV